MATTFLVCARHRAQSLPQVTPLIVARGSRSETPSPRRRVGIFRRRAAFSAGGLDDPDFSNTADLARSPPRFEEVKTGYPAVTGIRSGRMRTKPAAEVRVDTTLVSGLLEEQHADLAHLAPIKVAEGWDNTIFRLGEELAVRLPRRAASAILIEQEQRWLPRLADRLPLPVPVPVRVGKPSALFGWSWSIVRWLPGETLLQASLHDSVATAALLERFFLALHTPALADAPTNPFRGVPLEARTPALHDHLRQIEHIVDRRAVFALWDRALRWSRGPVWLHADLHPGNLLMRDGRLAGVIDFGDLTSGDPATDLSVLWMLPASVRRRFRAWSGDEPAALQMRARGWALALSLAYLAHSRDDATMTALARRTIDAVLTG
jgi:aminoglycoside phosphotransferase (APT) family kinase protein